MRKVEFSTIGGLPWPVSDRTTRTLKALAGSADLLSMLIELCETEHPDTARRSRRVLLDALHTLGGEASRHVLMHRARADRRFTDRERSIRVRHQALIDLRLEGALGALQRDGLIESPRWGVWRVAAPALAVGS